MANVSAESPVGRVVAEFPGAARVFEGRGIDYCCAGKLTIERACAARGLDPAVLLREIAAVIEPLPGQLGPHMTEWPAAVLADHIESTHHAFLKAELPRLSGIVAKVALAHGEGRPELCELATIFERFREEMEAHMMKEERVLFPWIRRLERGGNGFPPWGIGSPIGCMEHEHEQAGAALASMRALTNGFVPPANACATYRVMLASLEGLERDTHSHVHKENSILFPKAQKLEDSRRASADSSSSGQG